ncbi:hypothetical protein KC354_g149 [Hortaea werneckii]|nr:hypothetical protein KC354_g149 [Hortaea werneckii]
MGSKASIAIVESQMLLKQTIEILLNPSWGVEVRDGDCEVCCFSTTEPKDSLSISGNISIEYFILVFGIVFLRKKVVCLDCVAMKGTIGQPDAKSHLKISVASTRADCDEIQVSWSHPESMMPIDFRAGRSTDELVSLAAMRGESWRMNRYHDGRKENIAEQL